MQPPRIPRFTFTSSRSVYIRDPGYIQKNQRKMEMVVPSLEPIRESVEKSVSFIDWLIEVLRGKNSVKKLLLLEILLLTAFNPLLFPGLFERYTGKAIAWYPLVFWPAVAMVFIAAVITAVRVKQRESNSLGGQWDKRSAIKGLLPFGFADAKLFSRLQREENFRECLPVLTSTDFRFGVICGESGCGKTSFLQAGLWPRLLEEGRRCLYVKFTDLDPLDSIRLALVEQFKLPRESVTDADFITLLDAAVAVDGTPVIVLFDQFEQFFVHSKREKQRKPFVQALATWYRQQPPMPVGILICLREDFTGKLIELQKAMGYALGPQQSFRLEKFEPEKAAKIFQVIAETENVRFDEAFVDEFTRRELASRDDGLVSPVDIQILAWMVSAQRSQVDRTFNRESFQKLGGIEGLLERFLNRVLESRETETRRHAAIKVLLALTDLDGNARAGVLTLAALKQKLTGTAANAEVEEATEWLSRADVRLANRIDDGYELAHERLIPALRRVAGKELSIADKANQLLDRRVNEWLGNNQTSRYLLAWREWQLIEQQRPYLVWGPQRTHKESLLVQSKRRWRIGIASVAIPVLLVSLSVIGYMIWRRSEKGQIYQIKSELLNLSQSISDKDDIKEIVQALVFADMTQQALQVADSIKDPAGKDSALVAIARALAKVASAQQSPELFNQAISVTKRIEDHQLKGEALKEVAEAVTTSNFNSQQSGALFNQAIEIAMGMKPPHLTNALGDIARRVAKAAVAHHSEDLLGITISLANSVAKDHEVDPSFKAFTLSDVANTISDFDAKQSLNLFNEAISSTGGIERSENRIEAIIVIAKAIAKVDARQSTELFNQAIDVAKQVSDDEFTSKDAHLGSIAESIISVAENGKSSELANKAIEVVKDIDDDDLKGITLMEIAPPIGRIAVANQSMQLLNSAVSVARPVAHPNASDALRDLAKSMVKIAVVSQSSEIRDQAVEVAAKIEDPDQRVYALQDIAVAIAPVDADQSFRLFTQSIDTCIAELRIKSTSGKDSSWDTSTKIQSPGRTIGPFKVTVEAIAQGDVKQSVALLDHAINSANAMLDPHIKATALLAVSGALAEKNAKQANELFQQAVSVAKELTNPSLRASTLAEIVRESLETQPIKQVIDVAREIDDPAFRAPALKDIADFLGKSDAGQAAELYNQAAETAKKLESSRFKAITLSEIAKSIVEVALATHRSELINLALSVAKEVDDPLYEPKTLTNIAVAAVKLNHLRFAREAVLMNRDNSDKANTLALVLKTWAEMRSPALSKLAEKEQRRVEGKLSSSFVIASTVIPQLAKEHCAMVFPRLAPA